MSFGRVQTADGGGPVLRLHAGPVVLPGMSEPAQWQPSRTFGAYKGVLVRGASMIAVRQAALPGSPVRITVTGSWLHLDLIVLTACFAVMARRRRDHLIALRVAAMTSHGPV